MRRQASRLVSLSRQPLWCGVRWVVHGRPTNAKGKISATCLISVSSTSRSGGSRSFQHPRGAADELAGGRHPAPRFHWRGTSGSASTANSCACASSSPTSKPTTISRPLDINHTSKELCHRCSVFFLCWGQESSVGHGNAHLAPHSKHTGGASTPSPDPRKSVWPYGDAHNLRRRIAGQRGARRAQGSGCWWCTDSSRPQAPFAHCFTASSSASASAFLPAFPSLC